MRPYCSAKCSNPVSEPSFVRSFYCDAWCSMRCRVNCTIRCFTSILRPCLSFTLSSSSLCFLALMSELTAQMEVLVIGSILHWSQLTPCKRCWSWWQPTWAMEDKKSRIWDGVQSSLMIDTRMICNADLLYRVWFWRYFILWLPSLIGSFTKWERKCKTRGTWAALLWTQLLSWDGKAAFTYCVSAFLRSFTPSLCG
jgi:hypothetical protein